MENCLVTKLKSNVDNNNLEFITEATLEYVIKDNYTKAGLIVANTLPSKLILPEGEYLTQNDYVTPLTSVSQNVYELPAAAYTQYHTLYFSNTKHAHYFFRLTEAPTLIRFGNIGSDDKIRLTGSTAIFRTNHSLRRFGSSQFTLSNNFAEDATMSDFFHNTTLAQISLGNNKIPGSIESMVEAQWNYGRRSGELNATQASNCITLNGVLMEENINYRFEYSDNGVNVYLKGSASPSATFNGSNWTYA